MAAVQTIGQNMELALLEVELRDRSSSNTTSVCIGEDLANCSKGL